jgi:hypothetical protein
MLDIADDGSNDWIVREGKAPIINDEAVRRSVLRIETRKWLMGKLLAQKVEASGSIIPGLGLR